MTIKTWSDVQAQISLHKLPYSVLRFNMSLTGVLIDTATGDTLATSVIEAKQVIEQGAASPSTLTDDDGGRTRIGNTPTCEDCDQPLDSCTCEDDESPATQITEDGYTGDGFTHQADEDAAEQEACDRARSGQARIGMAVNSGNESKKAELAALLEWAANLSIDLGLWVEGKPFDVTLRAVNNQLI